MVSAIAIPVGAECTSIIPRLMVSVHVPIVLWSVVSMIIFLITIITIMIMIAAVISVVGLVGVIMVFITGFVMQALFTGTVGITVV